MNEQWPNDWVVGWTKNTIEWTTEWMSVPTDRQTDRRTDRRADRQTDRLTDEQNARKIGKANGTTNKTNKLRSDRIDKLIHGKMEPFYSLSTSSNRHHTYRGSKIQVLHLLISPTIPHETNSLPVFLGPSNIYMRLLWFCVVHTVGSTWWSSCWPIP